MTQPVIEPATQADIEPITALWVDLAHGQREYGSAVRAVPNRKTMRETLAAHLHVDGLLVARLDGDIVGFASFSVQQGSLELDATRGLLSNLYVLPAHRDRGIGSKLLTAVEDALADRGVEHLLLEVMAGNEHARRFYRSHGYEPFRIGMCRSIDRQSENDTHTKEDR